MNRIVAYFVITLIILCAIWESVGAPLRADGTIFAFKGFLLLPLLPAIWRGERSRFLTLSLVILLYSLEGITRAYSDINPISRGFAMAEIVFSVIIFTLSNRYLKKTNTVIRTPRTRPIRSRLFFWIIASVCLQLLMPSFWQAQANNETAYLWVRLGLAFTTFLLLLTYLFRLYQSTRLHQK